MAFSGKDKPIALSGQPFLWIVYSWSLSRQQETAMGKGEADQLPPDTVEEEGTAEMEKSMSNSEGTILQYSANVSWSR